MGIYSRLFLPILCIIVFIPWLRFSLLIDAETHDTSVRYQRESLQLGHYLANTILPLVGMGDDASVSATLSNTLLLNAGLRSIQWQRPGQQLSSAPAQASVTLYPSWFRDLIDLGPIKLVLPVALNNGASGTLTLLFSPHHHLNRIWERVGKQTTSAAINLMLVFVIYILLALILRANWSMLRQLAHATERFKQGEHGVRMALSTHLTQEARALVTTFNNMAGEVQGLVSSLKTSQTKLGDQLLKTLDVQSALQKMSWESQHDSLTSLPNRAALTSRFEQLLFLAKTRKRPLAVCLFDLDHFTAINKRLDTTAGDDILKQVAQRLRHFAGTSHYAARLGGDEFVLLLADQSDVAAIEQTVAQLLCELEAVYRHAGTTLTLSVSAGIALYHGNEMSTETLLRQADQALYQAKLTGRGKYYFFDAGLDEEMRSHHNQRTEIFQALLAGEMRLFYQPKVNMRAGDIVGMEALLRWQHPQRGLLGPAHFLPMIEHDALMIDIGEWVLRQALSQIQIWSAAGQPWVVSVNIAARQFQQADFVLRLRAILAEFPAVAASQLELEVLESAALDDIDHVRSVMTACQALGITFALDDFGTGYSTMRYLKRLPANILKIDQSFVRDMLDDQDDLYLVCAVIGLAKSFRLEVIAEGVETIDQGTRLMQLGCDLAQGFCIAHPMPADAVLAWAADFVPAAAWQTALPA